MAACGGHQITTPEQSTSPALEDCLAQVNTNAEDILARTGRNRLKTARQIARAYREFDHEGLAVEPNRNSTDLIVATDTSRIYDEQTCLYTLAVQRYVIRLLELTGL